jgi:hypothetical protein
MHGPSADAGGPFVLPNVLGWLPLKTLTIV